MNYCNYYKGKNMEINKICKEPIIVFVLFLFLYICAIYKSIKQNNLIVLILISIYLILGLSETAMIRFTYNFTFLSCRG